MYRGTALRPHPQVGEGGGEGGLLAGDHDVTESRGGGAGPDAGTVDGSNDGFGELDEDVETPLIALSDIPLDRPRKENISITERVHVSYYFGEERLEKNSARLPPEQK